MKKLLKTLIAIQSIIAVATVIYLIHPFSVPEWLRRAYLVYALINLLGGVSIFAIILRTQKTK